MQISTLALALATILPTQFQGGPPPGQGGPPGMMGGQERKILATFDLNKDKMLDAKERAAAKATLPTRPNRGGGRGPGGGATAGSPGPKVDKASVRPIPGKSLYDPTVLRTIFIDFEEANWEEELEIFNNTDVEVPAVVTIDGVELKNVGLAFRGASSYMMVPRGNKRSLNLSIDMVDGKQRALGYKTLNLLNSNGDASYMSTVLYSSIARQFIPAPRANFVKVVINGESWGIFVNVEQYNGDFVKTNFKSAPVEGKTDARWKVGGSPNGDGGLRFLGEDVALYKQRFEIKSKDTEAEWRTLIDLCRKLNNTPVGQLRETLSPILDIDGVLKFLALDIVLMNSDGYWTRASDYNLYRDHAGVFHVIPHDMNEAFRGGGMGRGPGGPGGPGGGRGPGGQGGPPIGQGGPPIGQGGPPQGGPGGQRGNPFELDPLSGLEDMRKPLRSKLLAVPELREKYLGYVREIAENHLKWEAVGPRIAAYRQLIGTELQADTRKNSSFEAFLAATNPEISQNGAPRPGGGGLRAFFDMRRAYLLRYLENAGS